MIRQRGSKRSSNASGFLIGVVDTGPLYAAVDADDDEHGRSVDVLTRPGLKLLAPAMVVAEATYLVGSRLGPQIEAAFLAGLASLEVATPAVEDWPRMAELVRQYADFPLGGTGASVITLAERLQTDIIITLDRRHFAALPPRHCAAWRLLPE